MSTLILPPNYQSQSPVATAHASHYRERFNNRLRAKYDAAQTNDDNERHWANADFLSPNTALNQATRRKIRSRARYEAQENNSHAKGMCLTLAVDLVGTGPRLQLKTPNRPGNQRVEKLFDKWCRTVRLAEKMTTGEMAQTIDGAEWYVLTTNPRQHSEVKLNLKGFEDDFCESPYGGYGEEQNGIEEDEFGNPVRYHLWRNHPGGSSGAMNYGSAGKGDWKDAENYIHLYREDRPGQKRGLSHLHSALPLLAMLRRFTLATLAAAETAADFAGVMKTTAASVEPTSGGVPFEAIPVEHRMLLTLPEGWDIQQMTAEHPTTTFEMFERRIIGAFARCLLMPYNVAALDSSQHNYASGRLDDRGYWKYIGVKQSRKEDSLLNVVLRSWYDEAALIPGYLPGGMGPFSEWDWVWNWDQALHVDPQKEATASELRIRTGVSNRVREMERGEGTDYDTEDQIAAESYGVPVEKYREALLNAHFSNGNAQTANKQGAADAEK